MRSTLLPCLLGVALLVPSARAQDGWTDTDVPQRFWIEVGGFRVSTQTNLRLSGGTPGDDVDFERDLNLPGQTTQAYIEAFWRPGRRHQVSLNWTRVRRDGGTVTLDRDIQWGDDVFRVGAEVQAATDSDFLSSAYRFALYKNDRFEVGPAIGVGYIWITAGLTGRAGVAGGGGGVEREINTVGKAGSITGDVGGYFAWWPGERFLARGDLRYIAVGLDGADAEIAEGRASLTWYPWSQVGVGAQYTYTKVRYDRDLLVTEVGGELQYDGLQILVSLAF